MSYARSKLEELKPTTLLVKASVGNKLNAVVLRDFATSLAKGDRIQETLRDRMIIFSVTHCLDRTHLILLALPAGQA